MKRKFFKERVEQEWKMYKEETLYNSREGIFVLSEITSKKKKIYNTLRQNEFTNEEIDILLATDNILDYLCVNVPSIELANLLKDIKEVLK